MASGAGLAGGGARRISPPMRILFVTATRIGDAVLSTGLLAHLVARYNGAAITIACGRAAAPLFEAVPGLERVIVLDKARLAGHWRHLWRETRRMRWDLAVDLRGSALAYLLRAGERRVVTNSHAPIHRVRQLAAAFGLDPPPAPKLWIGPGHAAEAARLLPAGGPILALGPTANWIGKQWPAERFADLAHRLTESGAILPGARVALFGAESERAMAAPLLQSLAEGQRIDLMGRTDLLTAYACLQRADLYIGNDSGLMHMAAASGVPVLGLFGPSRDEIYAPWGPLTSVVRTEESFAAITGRPGYDHRAALSHMGSLSVERVAAAAADLWRRAQAERAAASGMSRLRDE